MNAEQEKIFDTLRPYIQQYATGTIRSGIAEILAASTPALPGEVRLPEMKSEDTGTMLANVKNEGWNLCLARVRELNPTFTPPPFYRSGVAVEDYSGSKVASPPPTPQASTPPASTVERNGDIDCDTMTRFIDDLLDGIHLAEHSRGIIRRFGEACYRGGAHLAGASRRRVTDDELEAIEKRVWTEYGVGKGVHYPLPPHDYGSKVAHAVRDACEGRKG